MRTVAIEKGKTDQEDHAGAPASARSASAFRSGCPARSGERMRGRTTTAAIASGNVAKPASVKTSATTSGLHAAAFLLLVDHVERVD